MKKNDENCFHTKTWVRKILITLNIAIQINKNKRKSRVVKGKAVELK